MPKESPTILPTWAPRVAQTQIEKFYRVCGQGIVDEEIIDDVGISLYARCRSILLVMEAMRERRVTCPSCEAMIYRDRGPKDDEILICEQCNWKCEWEDYRNTFEGTYLNAGGGMKLACTEYEKKFKTARTYGEKIVLIDTLIHRFHGELRGGNKPGTYSLIEGEPHNIAAFLDRLTYGEHVPDQVRVRRERWRETLRGAPKFWRNQLRSDSTDETDKDD